MTAAAQIDHLVVAAATLAEGVAWCEATLGVVPGPGGQHPLMGTHNRLLGLGGERFARCYFEIIAIDPAAVPARARHQRRWFDLDDPVLQAALAKDGPRLVHWVARVPDARAAVHALASEPMHVDRGQVLAASRDTPQGRLSWEITVRDDGQRLFYGALPTLIEWGAMHPADHFAPSGLSLLALEATHPRPEVLRPALSTVGAQDLVAVTAGAPNFMARLMTPRGPVTLESKGL